MKYIDEQGIKTEALIQAAEQREREIVDYQINIDNYRLAIAKIDRDSLVELSEFRIQLEALLESSLAEQLKTKLIYDVIMEQLDVLQP